ncbi:SDR family oxidoreductase [Rhodobacterales bacterium HKCCE3408]|nr:SDR family oxidoreductase [Rhodobacterales bacterium HKCCE3408]
MSGAALVTGAGARLGQAMAIALAEAGLDVAIHYASSSDGAEETADAVRAHGRKAATLQADLLVEEDMHDLVPRAAEALGQPLTVLVNNASIFEYDDIESATKESWDRHIGSNLRAPFVLTQAFARQVPDPVADDRGEARSQALVVNMLDQRIRKLTPDFMTYTIAKMGLWAFTQTAARALAPKVRVNGIGPGPTLIGAHQSEDHFARQRAAMPLDRGSNPEDITGALIYLLKAPSVTGQVILTDAGQHIIWRSADLVGKD